MAAKRAVPATRVKRSPYSVDRLDRVSASTSVQLSYSAYNTWLELFHDWALYGNVSFKAKMGNEFSQKLAALTNVVGPISEQVPLATSLINVSKKLSIAFPSLTEQPNRHYHERVELSNINDEIPTCSSTMLSPTTNYAYSWGAQEILNRLAKKNNYSRVHWCSAAQLTRTFGATLKLEQEPAFIASEFDAVYPFSWLDRETQAYILSTTPFTRKTRLSSSSEGRQTAPFEGVFILRQGTGMRKQRNQSHGTSKIQWVRLKPWSRTEMFLCYRDKHHKPDRQQNGLYVSSSFVSSRGLKLYPPLQLVEAQKTEWAKMKGGWDERVRRFVSIPENKSSFPYPPVTQKPYFLNVPGPKLTKTGSWGWTPRWELFSLIAAKLHERTCPNTPRPSWLDHQIPTEMALPTQLFRAEVPMTTSTAQSKEGYSWEQVAPIEIGHRFPIQVYNADQLIVPSKGEPIRGLAITTSGKRFPQPASDILVAKSLIRQYNSPFWVTQGQAKRMGLLYDSSESVEAPTISGRGMPLSSLRKSVQEWLLSEFHRFAILKGDVDLITLVNVSTNTLPPTEQVCNPIFSVAKGGKSTTAIDDTEKAVADITGFFMYGCNGWERIHSQGPLAAFVTQYQNPRSGHCFLWVNIDETVVLLPPKLQRDCIPSHYFGLAPESERELILREASSERRNLSYSLNVSKYLQVHPCAKYIVGVENAQFIDLATISTKSFYNGSILKVGAEDGQATGFNLATAALSSQSAVCIGTDGRPFSLRISEKLLQHASTHDFKSPVWLTATTAGKLGVFIRADEKAKGFKPLNENSVEGLMALPKPSTTVYSLLFAEDPIGLALKHCANVTAKMIKSHKPTTEMAAIASRSSTNIIESCPLQEMPLTIPKEFVKVEEKRLRSIAWYLTRKQKIFLSQLSPRDQRAYLKLYARFFESKKSIGSVKFHREPRVMQADSMRFAQCIAQRFPAVTARELLSTKRWFDPSASIDPFSLHPHFELVINGKLKGYSTYPTKQLQKSIGTAEIQSRLGELLALNPGEEELLMKCAHFWISEDEVVLGGIKMMETATPVTLNAFVNGKGVKGCRGVDAARSMKRISTKEAAALAFPHKGNGVQSKWAVRKNLKRFRRRYYANKQYRTWYNADQTTDPQRVLALTHYFVRPAL